MMYKSDEVVANLRCVPLLNVIVKVRTGEGGVSSAKLRVARTDGQLSR